MWGNGLGPRQGTSGHGRQEGRRVPGSQANRIAVCLSVPGRVRPHVSWGASGLFCWLGRSAGRFGGMGLAPGARSPSGLGPGWTAVSMEPRAARRRLLCLRAGLCWPVRHWLPPPAPCCACVRRGIAGQRPPPGSLLRFPWPPLTWAHLCLRQDTVAGVRRHGVRHDSGDITGRLSEEQSWVSPTSALPRHACLGQGRPPPGSRALGSQGLPPGPLLF